MHMNIVHVGVAAWVKIEAVTCGPHALDGIMLKFNISISPAASTFCFLFLLAQLPFFSYLTYIAVVHACIIDTFTWPQ